ncbi:5-dehydro-4-deoxy-D-glucuronate isomerase [Zobellia galactanivorans]|uniref:5-dehydro-4-deoxy-D-glucuronate isomerase n=1 Tax=Zobellia galactanivorans (strain DSM 12802 / CCUG 47099 / CIP 106680 / NCIMB 13871 / Dsij) TaxID=63186 RepID=UPI0026E4366B|nr:5-dehydro-4-deoxy-D-glucuronate isomerase [Zobellia galactanivorans]MDO6809757.1 5-dehydro-4-deoxy-D-glucuronate isomerase [Zobellia galactanivorans]
MEVKYAVHPDDAKLYDTQRIRKEFHSSDLMDEDAIKMIYTHYDRFIYGTAFPKSKGLSLPTYDELKADYFLERRELGIINVGGKGTVTVDGEVFELGNLEALYVGKGSKEVTFASADGSDAAKFYLNSAPAHKEYPTKKATQSDANIVELGAVETSNERTLYQYIHEDGIQSCQLVMGYTELKKGSVWNTFPPHTHERRMEVYFYFDIPGDNIVMHYMGQPQETRHIAMKNYEAVVSPPWSIHSGSGTSNYRFIWGMAGENKAFTDMDGEPLQGVL